MKEIFEDYDLESELEEDGYSPDDPEERIMEADIQLSISLTPKAQEAFRKKIFSKKASKIRKKAKMLIDELTSVDAVLSIGVSNSGFADQLPMERLIHGFCVVGNLNNKSFNQIILIRDRISNPDELPIMPLPDFTDTDTEPYDIVWMREKSGKYFKRLP